MNLMNSPDDPAQAGSTYFGMNRPAVDPAGAAMSGPGYSRDPQGFQPNPTLSSGVDPNANYDLGQRPGSNSIPGTFVAQSPVNNYVPNSGALGRRDTNPLAGTGGGGPSSLFGPSGTGASGAPTFGNAGVASSGMSGGGPGGAPGTPGSAPSSAPPMTPFQGSPGTMGYGMSQVPGMSAPTQASLIGTYLQQKLAEAQSGFISHQIAMGTTTAQQQAQNIIDNAQQWAMLNPQLAAQVDWKGEANKAAQQYLDWAGGQPMSAFSSGAPATSLTTGQPLPYGYTKTGPQYNGATDPTVTSAAALGGWMPPLAKVGTDTGAPPTYNPTPWVPGKAWGGAGTSPGVSYVSGDPGTALAGAASTPASTPATDPNQGIYDAIKAYLGGVPNGVTTSPLGYTQYNSNSQGSSDQLMALVSAILSMSQSGAKRTSYSGLF